MKLVYRPAALADLDAIYDFIALDNPPRALSFIEDIRTHCRALRDFPQLGPARDDLGAGIRIHPMRGRVAAAYRIRPDAIEIVRVFHGGQDYAALLHDEN